MELRHLKYFVAVAEELHFRRAAERLHISQPPLSEQIHQLEDELGTRLLERDRGREVQLTVVGAAFLEEARRILLHVADAVEAVHRASRGEIGTLRISLAPAMAYGVVPMILRQLRVNAPMINLQLFEMVTPFKKRQFLTVGSMSDSATEDWNPIALTAECHPSRASCPCRPGSSSYGEQRAGCNWSARRRAIHYNSAGDEPGLYDVIFQTCYKEGFHRKWLRKLLNFKRRLDLYVWVWESH